MQRFYTLWFCFCSEEVCPFIPYIVPWWFLCVSSREFWKWIYLSKISRVVCTCTLNKETCEWLYIFIVQQASSELQCPAAHLLASMKPSNSATMTRHVIWAKVCISDIQFVDVVFQSISILYSIKKSIQVLMFEEFLNIIALYIVKGFWNALD